MQELPTALQPLAAYAQFILYKLVPSKRNPGKMDKLPVDHRTLAVFAAGIGWQDDPAAWTTAELAMALLPHCGPNHGLGFFFTEQDPFFFLDMDHCLLPDGKTWSPTALQLLAYFPGAAVEVSQSGTGLHVFAKGAAPAHGCKNIPLGLELYTSKRFVALTGERTIGSADLDCSAALGQVAATYFPVTASAVADVEWSAEPVPEWDGETDDGALLAKAMASRSAASAFGTSASFAQLWEADETALSVAFPDSDRAYDASAADAALAQHLAFWTGKNCERISTLMYRSALVRDKWTDREAYYLPRTIERAVGLQGAVHGEKRPVDAIGAAIAQEHGAGQIKGTSPAQTDFAEQVRAEKLAACGADPSAQDLLCTQTDAAFWTANKDRPIAELVAALTPITAIGPTLRAKAEVRTGFQFQGADLQLGHFAGCVYVQGLNKVLTPDGALQGRDTFNAVWGGFSFQIDDGGQKTTKKAFEAFTESQVVQFPSVHSTTFRPDLPMGDIFEEEGQLLVNTFQPIDTRREAGDPSRFLSHLATLLPIQRDQATLLAYLAALIQYPGVKFQWAPVIQGAPGNGKTFFTRCIEFAVGSRYTHLPLANELGEKYNDWLFGNLFIGLEDIYVPDHKKEVMEILKPMITNDRLAMRAMQQGQVMGRNCANFLINTNYKAGLSKHKDDRRFAPFFCAQQSKEEIEEDGMGGDYFPDLYAWMRGEKQYAELGPDYGYAVVAHFLETYQIPDALNPATACHRAPETTSTFEAVEESMGTVEQEILEAIDEGRLGFAGGWISSIALEHLLQGSRKATAISHKKRRDILASLGYTWHPALPGGRASVVIPTDGGKSRLYIKTGHVSANLTTSAEVVRAYEAAQTGKGGPTLAAAAFS